MDYETWAEWYDVFHSIADPNEVDFYVRQAVASSGPVLEIGVGTGRIAIPAAQAGVAVTGVDLNQAMLDKAQQKLDAATPLAGSVDLVKADMRDFSLGRTFPLVIIPGRTLLLLRSAGDQRRALRRAAAHLAPGGRLVLNVFHPNGELLADSSGEPFLMGETVNPTTGLRCRLWARNRFNTLAQTNRGLQIVEEFDADGKVVRRAELPVLLRYLHPSELHQALRSAGLRVLEVFGNYQGGALTEESDEMVFIAEKAL